MAVQVATGKKSKAKASPKPGPGSFGYPWGTERPNAVLRKLGEAQFAHAEDEIRRIEAETARRIRKIRMRVDMLDQIRRGVQQCCTVLADGKVRFNRDLAEAAGPLFDVSMARVVVDLDKRRPGRPSATANPDLQVLRAVMQDIVHAPAAEFRRQQVAGGGSPSLARGRECKTDRDLVPALGADATADHPSPLAPASDIVVPEASVLAAETVVEAISTADEARASAHAEVEADPQVTVSNDPDLEPEPEIEPLPELDPEMARVLFAARAEADSDGDRSEWDNEVEAVSDLDETVSSRMTGDAFGYFPSHSVGRIALREQRLDLDLLPDDQRETILPEVTSDPRRLIPALAEVIRGMDLPWDQNPKDASEQELRVMLDIGVSAEVGRRIVRDDWEWERIKRQAGGLHRVAEKNMSLLVDTIEAERLRREVWPLVVARRDMLNGLRIDVASGKMPYHPISNHIDDLENSLEYTIFKNADYCLLNSMSEDHWRMYAKIVDALKWPKGLSRHELFEKFGAGESADEIPNLCVYDPRYPKWLLPDHFDAIENAGIVAHINEERLDVSDIPDTSEVVSGLPALRRGLAALRTEDVLDGV